MESGGLIPLRVALSTLKFFLTGIPGAIIFLAACLLPLPYLRAELALFKRLLSLLEARELGSESKQEKQCAWQISRQIGKLNGLNGQLLFKPKYGWKPLYIFQFQSFIGCCVTSIGPMPTEDCRKMPVSLGLDLSQLPGFSLMEKRLGLRFCVGVGFPGKASAVSESPIRFFSVPPGPNRRYRIVC